MGIEWGLRSFGLCFERPPAEGGRLTKVQRLLERLHNRGLLEERDACLVLPFRHVYDLNAEERSVLGIPEPARLSVSLGTKGIPGNPSFTVKCEVRHPELGPLRSFIRRVGPFFLPSGEAPILVSLPLFRLLQVLDENLTGASIEDHFLLLGKVQELGKACGAVFEGMLAREEYEFPEALEIDLGETSPDKIELIPRIRGFYTEERLQEAIRRGTLPRLHFEARGRSRRRFVFSRKLRETLAEIDKRRFILGEDVPRFLENPEAYLPDDVNLSEFSKRVKGLRLVVYNSRPYLHITRSSGGWLEVEPRIGIEPVIGSDGDESKLDVKAAPGDTAIPFQELRDQLENAAKSGRDFIRFRNGWLRVPAGLSDFTKVLQQGTPLSRGRLRLSKQAVLEIYENLEILEYAEGEYLPPGWDPEQLPPFERSRLFQGRLYPHQELGVRWLSLLASRRTGGLLADEMGLGKTVQVLAHMARLAERGELQPSLVVCPKTLVPVWCEELNRFLPRAVRFAVLEGGQVSAETLRQLDLVLCSYDVLRRNQLEMGRVDWQLVVCDEAQYVKNPTAQRTSSAKALKARHRVALTGTPVENGLVEFWCILDFVAPGLLGSWREFRDRFERPIAVSEDPGERERLTEKLLQKLGHHYLRRAKDEVLRSLPPRESKVLETPLGRLQLQQYVQIARQAKSAGRGAVLAAIHQLFLVCGHPRALSRGTELFQYRPGECPKLDRTIELLKEIQDRGEKAIIFTRWLALQEILAAAIEQVFNLRAQVINGQIQGNRMQIVEQFSRRPGFNVLILSHDVGGVGLTITAANHVIHYTRPWNPAKEAQATDRVHRIGQQKAVTVYYPIAVDPGFKTVEVRLAELLEEKKDLAKNVLRPTSSLSVRPQEFVEAVEAAGGMADQTQARVVSAMQPDERSPERRTSETCSPWSGVWEASQKLRPGDRPYRHEIKEGAKGYSFLTILEPFQRGARKIELRDPQMFRSENLARLVALGEALLAAGRRSVLLRLIGSPPIPEEEEVVRAQLEALRAEWTPHGVDLQVIEEAGINESHARFDTGWRLVFSGGFNLFQETGSSFPVAEKEQLATPCRETTIWIYREAVPEKD